jgi:hypothetical protein
MQASDDKRTRSAALFASEEPQMHVSPTIAVLAIVTIGLAGTAWFAPPPCEVARVIVMLPTATYQKLALWGKEHAGAEGRPLTVVQVIEGHANRGEKDHEAPANDAGARVR